MRFVAALAALAVASSAVAQDAPADWDIHRDPAQELVLAYTVFDNGLGIAGRCMDGAYEVVINGLPEPADADASVRRLEIAFGDEPRGPSQWNVAANRTAVIAEFPAPFARKLRQGGRLQIVVPDGAGPGRNLRYDLALPTSNASIDETLTTCGRPLVDPRDAELAALSETGLPVDLDWARPPRAQYPSNTRYARGFATVTCMTNTDGGLRDCVVEAESPHGEGFGDNTLRATRRARVGWADDRRGPVPSIMVAFRAYYVIDGYQTSEDRRRQRESAD